MKKKKKKTKNKQNFLIKPGKEAIEQPKPISTHNQCPKMGKHDQRHSLNDSIFFSSAQFPTPPIYLGFKKPEVLKKKF